MFIKVKNIRDFLGFILNLVGNGEPNIRVFVSAEERYPNIYTSNDNKDYTKFTFVICSHIYQVVYSEKVKTTDYNNIFKQLTDYQDSLNAVFRIQVFKKITISKDFTHITVENELNVI